MRTFGAQPTNGESSLLRARLVSSQACMVTSLASPSLQLAPSHGCTTRGRQWWATTGHLLPQNKTQFALKKSKLLKVAVVFQELRFKIEFAAVAWSDPDPHSADDQEAETLHQVCLDSEARAVSTRPEWTSYWFGKHLVRRSCTTIRTNQLGKTPHEWRRR